MSILNILNERKVKRQKSLAILIDPDKVDDLSSLKQLLPMSEECYVDFFFVGGSLMTNNNLSQVVKTIKNLTDIPVVLFPGNTMQIDIRADAILFLSLISGRNPDLLIGQHVVSAPILKGSSLEILPTGYMLVNAESTSAVSYMSNTRPIPPDKDSVATCTAMAGEMLGLKLIYMDAGSGSRQPIPARMISKVRRSIDAPLIVGGGINSSEKAKHALEAGADMIVIGNAIEKDPNLLIEISEKIYDFNKSLNIH
ncbi:geranylgeranylglyceryl/heptaprenylglyceryl phosphate synthase [Fulvivirga sp. M361]|uniref:geranylgeranylglyceryl/heptaprenylglyceryl phosphate synthase n=1 Tax=Fulvivirga sp. M361 TaxID=2594266 RepID=UPI00117ACF44|nr:geranylgeranylglyceryl/heptaprenylglyceryl phosphate synthase [Fulvivirga sp. M361]TRX61441.1 geranylgeranylglyceryl/heptaprenylglyceryl phosphate synthase [Fulvivirga sp. M361]